MTNEIILAGASLPASNKTSQTMAEKIFDLSVNPDFDIEKLKGLMQIFEMQNKRNDEAEFATALANLHYDIELMATDIAGQDSRYLTFEMMNAKTKKPLHDNGFSLSFEHGSNMDGWQTIQTKSGETPIMLGTVTVKGVLRHKTNLFIETSLTVPFDFSGSKKSNSAQAQGSALSYAKRYIMASLLKIATFDDDAQNTARTNQLAKLTTTQAESLKAIYNQMAPEKQSQFDGLLAHNNLDSISDIPKNWFTWSMAELQKIANSQPAIESQGGSNAQN